MEELKSGCLAVPRVVKSQFFKQAKMQFSAFKANQQEDTRRCFLQSLN